MEASLTASAITAGQLFSGSTFVVPPYQREYAWGDEEVNEFWLDLRQAVGQQEYFLGLVIVTEEGERRHLVDVAGAHYPAAARGPGELQFYTAELPLFAVGCTVARFAVV